MKLWNRLRYMKLINICHLLCFNCKMQGKMLTLRDFTALACQTVAVLLIPVISPLCKINLSYLPFTEFLQMYIIINWSEFDNKNTSSQCAWNAVAPGLSLKEEGRRVENCKAKVHFCIVHRLFLHMCYCCQAKIIRNKKTVFSQSVIL